MESHDYPVVQPPFTAFHHTIISLPFITLRTTAEDCNPAHLMGDSASQGPRSRVSSSFLPFSIDHASHKRSQQQQLVH
jgi:hypothetical protein